MLIVEDRTQRSTPQTVGLRRTHEIENRRNDINVLHWRDDAAAGAFAIRLFDDQRHVQRGVVERHARTSFTVIANHENRRALVQTMLLQRGREPRDGSVCITAIDLNEEEEPLAAAHLNPALGGINCQRAFALDRGHFVDVGRGDFRVEKREAL